MPGRPETVADLQTALKRPAVYNALPKRKRQAVDALQAQIKAQHDWNPDVDYVPDPRLLRLLRKIEREANP